MSVTEGVDLLMFKINRENEDRLPTIQLVDCQSDVLQHIIVRDPRRFDDEEEETTGVIVEPYVLEDYPNYWRNQPNRGEYANRLFNLDNLCGGRVL